MTRSNRSSATGSQSEPSRTSTRTSLRAALKAVTARARGFTSVATTSSACAAQVQRLDAAAGAEVERAADRLAQGQLGQRGRGGADAEHVVGGDPDQLAVETRRQVADDPPVVVVVGVRAAVEERPHLAAGATSMPPATSGVDQPGERAVGVRRGRPSVWSRNSRTRVSSGDPPVVRRRAGVVSLRASASWPVVPSRSPTASKVYVAAARASRSAGARVDGRDAAGCAEAMRPSWHRTGRLARPGRVVRASIWAWLVRPALVAVAVVGAARDSGAERGAATRGPTQGGGGRPDAQPGKLRAQITFTKSHAHPWHSTITWDAARQRADGTWKVLAHDSWRAGSGCRAAAPRTPA